MCFGIHLRTNIDLRHLHHKLIDFYNRGEKYLQPGTDRVFQYSSLLFVFKWLTKVQTTKICMKKSEN
jgi:hypothetical protein